jgi:hypothetical protein
LRRPLESAQFVRRAELDARVDPTILAPEPFAIEQVRASELGAHPCSAQVRDCRTEPALGPAALTQERS